MKLPEWLWPTIKTEEPDMQQEAQPETPVETVEEKALNAAIACRRESEGMETTVKRARLFLEFLKGEQEKTDAQ